MDKIEINLGDDGITCDKMIATVKSSERNNMLEQLVAGNWTLEELITAKSNFEKLLEQQIYKSLGPQQQSLLDNIEEKETEMKENLLKNLTSEEEELYEHLHGFSHDKTKISEKLDKTKQNNPPKSDQTTSSSDEDQDKVVNLNEYRKSK